MTEDFTTTPQPRSGKAQICPDNPSQNHAKLSSEAEEGSNSVAPEEVGEGVNRADMGAFIADPCGSASAHSGASDAIAINGSCHC